MNFYEDDFYEDYLKNYILLFNKDLPKISILDLWHNYSQGLYTFYLKQFVIYPLEKLEVISNIDDMSGDFIISANKRISNKSIITNYLRKKNYKESYLYTKSEYINKYIKTEKINVAIKNFKRNFSSNLVALSVKHFIPDANIFLFNFYDERDKINLNDINENIFTDIINLPSKYLLGQLLISSENARNNGLYYTESFNLIYKYFQNFDGKLLILDENHFFTNGSTLREILDNEFDIAYAFYSGVPPSLNGKYQTLSHRELPCVWCGGFVNASILCLNPDKFKNIFPLKEEREYIEIILTDSLLNNDLVKYQIKNRYDGDYFDDGIATNSDEIMLEKMLENNIPLF